MYIESSDFILLGVFGVVLFFAGHHGLKTYTLFFYKDPKATMTADLIITLASGPGIVPVVLCLLAMLTGAIFILIPMIVLFFVVQDFIF